MKNLLSFDWVLEIKTTNPLIVLILFHPIYIIWMLKIGRLGEIAMSRKKNIIFLILNAFLLIVMTFVFILSFDIIKLSEDSQLNALYISHEDTIMSIIIGLIAFSWLYCSYYTMITTIRLEELINKDYYPSISDKIYRFFQILYWIFGIWVIQPKINEYYTDLMKPNP